MAEVDGKVIMQGPEGHLFMVSPEGVPDKTNEGWTLASQEAVDQRVKDREQYAKYGSTGQQAIAAGERAVRAGTLGAVSGIGDEEDNRGRANVLAQESPVIDAVAGAVPAVAADAAMVASAPVTGGLSLTGLAAQGALGAYSNVGEAQNEAFKRDEELSAEQAWGAAGEGFISGAAIHGALGLAGKGVGAARDRIVEASARVTRQAEQRAAESLGLTNVEQSTFRAVDNPERVAAVRQAADEAKPAFNEQAQKAIGDLDTEATKVHQSTSASALDEAFPAPLEDTSKAAPALKGLVDDVESGLPSDSPYRAVVDQWRQDISATGKTSSGLLGTADSIANDLKTLISESRDPDVVKLFQSAQKNVAEYSKSETLFGEKQAMSASDRASNLEELQAARSSLGSLLEQNDYTSVVGTKAGDEIQQAAERYGDAIKKLSPESAGSVNEAIGKMTAPAEIKAGNHVDAFSNAPKPKQPKSPSGGLLSDLKGEGIDMAANYALHAVSPVLGAASGVLRTAWKYRKHIFNLSGDARSAAVSAAESAARAVTSNGVQIGARGAARAALGSLFSGTPGETDEHRYNNLKSSLQKLIQEPDRIADALSTQMGESAYDSPDLHMAMAQKTAKAVAFLNDKMPPSFQYSLAYPDGPPPSRTDMLQMSLYVRGATQPKDVLKDIGSGSAMPEEVEAFRAVFPAWFSEFQEELSQKVQSDARAGKPLGGMKIAQLTGLLDLDGGIDPVFGKSIALISQTADQLSRQQTASPSYIPPPKTGDRITPNSPGIQRT